MLEIVAGKVFDIVQDTKVHLCEIVAEHTDTTVKVFEIMTDTKVKVFDIVAGLTTDTDIKVFRIVHTDAQVNLFLLDERQGV